MKRAYSIRNVLDAKFKTLYFEGEWKDAVGYPELGGSWVIYGAPKNGKTSLAMKLAKYLTRFCRVAYDSVEEGLSLSIQNCVQRTFCGEVSRRFILLDKENVEELTEKFPHKLFIFVSHVDGNQPEGRVAKKIWRDANVYIRVEGFRGFPVGRYTGGKPIDVNPAQAIKYWRMQN